MEQHPQLQQNAQYLNCLYGGNKVKFLSCENKSTIDVLITNSYQILFFQCYESIYINPELANNGLC